VTRAGARFGIVFLPESLGDFGRLCREAEEAGFDLLSAMKEWSPVTSTMPPLLTSRRTLSPGRSG
jgi:hypothetical protein